MQAVRLLLAQRHLAVLICAATLLLKLLVPNGYMIDNDGGRFAVTMCSGAGPVTMAMIMPGMHGGTADHDKKDHGKAEMPCPFSSLSAAITAAVDPIQLAELIAFVMAVGLAGMPLPAPSSPTYLRPPLRGPPAFL